MPVIKLNGQQFALQPGLNRLGGGATADVIVGGEGIQAIVELGADGRASIRKTGAGSILVNGTELSQPTPLIHGDKVEISGQEMYFADDAKGGSTQFVSAADVAAIAAKRTGPARGTLASGGRLVSLVDGKEYTIPDAGITIGRDASADIVVPQTAVSRRHAQVVVSGNGYVVNDLSTNGVFVNGEKVQSGHQLSRADVIRVGTEEFRFYADLAPMAKGAPAGAPAATPQPPAAVAPPAPVAEPVAARPVSPASAPTPPARPATPPPVAAPATSPRPATPPPAPQPSPTAQAAQVSKHPTPPSRPATPRPAPQPPRAEPVTTKKGVPTWAILLVIVAAAAVAAYFFMQRP